MRPLKQFDAFVNEGIVKKQMIDKARSESLKKESEKAYLFLLKMISKMGIEECEPNYIIKNSYDIIMEIIRAKMLSEGFNASGDGAHEAEVAYLRFLYFSEAEIQFLNQLRYFRNGILYYGKVFDKNYAENVLQYLDKIYKKLKKDGIKLIIFDIGGILVENYDIPMFEALTKACNKPRNIIEQECTELMHKSERGEITEYEFIEQFLKKMHCKEDPKKILDARRKATKEKSGTRELIEKIKKHYKVAFATNNAEEEFAYNNKVMHFDKLFDWGIASCNVHARKTESKMFEEILKHFKVKPEETIFIDDSVANLKAPKELGIHTLQFISLEQVKDELKKIERNIC